MTISRARLVLRELWAHWLDLSWATAWQAADAATGTSPSRAMWSEAVSDATRAYGSTLRLEVEPVHESASIVRLRIASPAAAGRGEKAKSTESESRRDLPPRGPDGRFIRRSSGAKVSSTPAAKLPDHPPLALGEAAVARAVEAPPVTAIRSTEQAPMPVIESGSQEPVPTDRGAAPPLRALATADVDLSANRPIRIVLVEDVAEVATHVRDVLRPQGRFQLVHTIHDGQRAADEIRDLDPDVVLVDSLLQGKTSARQIVDRLRGSGRPLGIVVMTVPDYPAEASMLEQADAVVSLPFGTFDLGRAVMAAHAALTARDPGSTSRVVSVFSAKGGVGRTTIAYNLAASLATTGLRTVLLDGSLQFGDVRRLLRADPTQPSICDLPTDSIRGSDLSETVVQVGPGLDVLLAPPRPELAELINGRDLGRVLDILRRAYQAIVIDTPANLAEPTLALLDASDVIIDVLTAEPAALEATRLIAATFPEIGYPSNKIRYLVNRADSVGAAPMTEIARAVGRTPEYTLASDWPLVSASNRDGVPYVLAQPEAPVSLGLRRVAHDVRALAVEPPLPLEARRGSRIA